MLIPQNLEIVLERDIILGLIKCLELHTLFIIREHFICPLHLQVLPSVVPEWRFSVESSETALHLVPFGFEGSREQVGAGESLLFDDELLLGVFGEEHFVLGVA